jgi:endo-alpha-1,4-polygalactosaminidase (GH114 family)
VNPEDMAKFAGQVAAWNLKHPVAFWSAFWKELLP